jgi:cytochrome c oxidase subunit IV
MAIATSDSQHRHEHGAGHGALRYWIVWVLLLVGTMLTFALSRVHLPSPFHLLVALAIASAKSMLVVLFFMHLWEHYGAPRLIFATSILFIVLLISLAVMDNATRFALLNPGHGATLQMEPPGPDILTPRGPPVPSERLDMPAVEQQGRDVPKPPPGPAR